MHLRLEAEIIGCAPAAAPGSNRRAFEQIQKVKLAQSSWSGPVRHLTGLLRAEATALMLRSRGYSRLIMWGLTAGPTASFSMYMHGPGSNREPLSAMAMTETAPLRPCLASRAQNMHPAALASGSGAQ